MTFDIFQEGYDRTWLVVIVLRSVTTVHTYIYTCMYVYELYMCVYVCMHVCIHVHVLYKRKEHTQII